MKLLIFHSCEFQKWVLIINGPSNSDSGSQVPLFFFHLQNVVSKFTMLYCNKQLVEERQWSVASRKFFMALKVVTMPSTHIPLVKFSFRTTFNCSRDWEIQFCGVPKIKRKWAS